MHNTPPIHIVHCPNCGQHTEVAIQSWAGTCLEGKRPDLFYSTCKNTSCFMYEHTLTAPDLRDFATYDLTPYLPAQAS